MPPRPARTSHPAGACVSLAALLALAARGAGAQSEGLGSPHAAPVGLPAATVPVTDPATGIVDQLLALVPVRGAIVGQRPYAVREVVRLATAATRELARRDSVRRASARPESLAPARPGDEVRAAVLATALLDAYAPAAPARGLQLRALDFAWAHGVGSAEAPRQLPATNGPGFLDARTLPALDLRYGRPAVLGAVGSLETAHALGIGNWLALVAQPRASLVVERRPDGATHARVDAEPQRLFARAVVQNVALQAGVDEWAWGQGGAGGTFLSAATRPLRAVSVQADTAFLLPGFLRGAGRWRAALAVADLGQTQNFPHAKLAAYKLSLAPSPVLELGGGVMSQFGGHGAPHLRFADRVVDLFPYLGWLDKGSDKLASNKIATFDVRARAPRWAGFTAAWEVDFDDMDFRRFGGVLRDDAAHLVDVQWARLRPDGGLALALTAQRTGIRMYEHTPFVSGVTYREGIIGSPLGPHATALAATLTWRPRPLDAVAFTVTRETRDPSLYVTRSDNANDRNFRFVRVEARPVERRLRAALLASRAVAGRGTSLDLRLGAERAANYAYQAGATRTRPFGEAGARVRF